MGLAIDSIYDIPSSGAIQVIQHVVSPPRGNINFYRASGGTPTLFFISSSGDVVIERTDSRPQNIINEISSCFNLTKEELASVCKVQSRKTLYNWMEGRQPRASTMERLFDLLMIATAWKQSNFPNDYESLRRASLGKSSVLEMLKSDTLDREKILFAGSRLALINSGSTLLRDPFV